MRVGVIGAGAVGSYYAALLCGVGVQVVLGARGAHRNAIVEQGLEIRTPHGRSVVGVEVVEDPESFASCDYILLAVKSFSLAEVASILLDAAQHGAAIVCLLNGIEGAERLEALGIPRAAIISGLVHASLVRPSPGVVERRSPFDRVVLGERDDASSARAERLSEALRTAGVESRVSAAIEHDLWKKFAAIVPLGVGCGLLRSSAGPVLGGDLGRVLVATALDEVVAVSRIADRALSEEDRERIWESILEVPASMRPSFLDDLERGGPTELDILAGSVCRLGRRLSIPTPIHDLANSVFACGKR
jgi:2-dehydropantoate 2-reductase